LRNLILFIKRFLPYSWWVKILTFIAHIRLLLWKDEGITHSWIWDREDGILNKEVCQRLIEEEILPSLKIVAQSVPQLYGIDRLFTLITIHTPELKALSKKRFFLKIDQLDEVKQRIFDFFINKVPMEIRRGSYISFKVSSLTELVLLDLPLEQPWYIRPISKIL